MSSGSSSSSRGRKRGREIKFDPEARRDYLRGFSERKRQRRAFGLAMQKVKDRKAKLEERRETKQSEMERIEEAERQKQVMLEGRFGKAPEEAEEENNQGSEKETNTTAYLDADTRSQWGGQVIVTTTATSISDKESDEEADESLEKKKSVDRQQKYAGQVERFLNEFKGKMPSKKGKERSKPKKGRHGAESMKGIGGASGLRLAQKALAKFKSQGTEKPKRSKGKRKR